MAAENSVETGQKSERSLLISADDLAVLIGVSTRTVWRLLSSGKLIEPVRLGGNVRWNRSHVEEWIENGCPAAMNSNSTKQASAMRQQH